MSATAGKLAGGETEGEETVDPELERARSLWDDGEFDDATTAYQAILDAQPAHVEAKDALRQIAFLKRATSRAPDSVAAAAAAPDDIEAAFDRTEGSVDTELSERPTSIKTLEWERIHTTLAETDFNISETARRLGMHRRTLARKLEKRPVK